MIHFRKLFFALAAFIALGFSVADVKADVVFVTPANATSDGGDPISGKATLTQNGNILTVKLENTLQSNIKSVGQAISGFQFSIVGLSVNSGSLTLTSDLGRLINVNGNQTFSDIGGSSAADDTDWTLSSSSGAVKLYGLGNTGPDQTILNAPDNNNKYSNANGSIAGNGPHNPFIMQTATFTFSVAGLPANAQFNNAVFFFGTTPQSVSAIPNAPVPEPATMLLLGTGLAGVAARIRRRRKADKNEEV